MLLFLHAKNENCYVVLKNTIPLITVLTWTNFNISADDDENNIDTSVRYRDFVSLINLKTLCILLILYLFGKCLNWDVYIERWNALFCAPVSGSSLFMDTSFSNSSIMRCSFLDINVNNKPSFARIKRSCLGVFFIVRSKSKTFSRNQIDIILSDTDQNEWFNFGGEGGGGSRRPFRSANDISCVKFDCLFYFILWF